MKDFGSASDRARKPTKGIRVKLRTALKQAGVSVKFRTNELRNGVFVVISTEKIDPPFTTFADRKVIFITRPTTSENLGETQ